MESGTTHSWRANWSRFASVGANWQNWAYPLLTSATAIGALYVAMWLELATPRWAMLSVLIVSPPSRGDALRKSIARLVGTPIGCAAAVALTALFPQDPAGYLIGLSMWMGGCALIATRSQGYAAYAATLAGFTVAIIGTNTSTQPQHIFYVAAERGAETTVGVLAAMMASVVTTRSGNVVDVILSDITRSAIEIIRWIETLLAADSLPGNLPFLEPALIHLPAQIANAHAEQPGLRRVRESMHGVPTALVDLQWAGLALAAKLPQEPQDRTDARRIIANYEELLASGDIEADFLRAINNYCFIPGSRVADLSSDLAELQESLRFVLLTIVAIRKRKSLPFSAAIFPPVHLDRRWDLSVAAFARTVLGICIAFAVWDLTTWQYGNVLLGFTALLIAATTVVDDAAAGFRGVVTSCALGCVLGLFTLFWILPLSDRFAWLALVLLPALAIGPFMPEAGCPPVQGILFATGFAVVLSPTNPQQYPLVQSLEEAAALILATAITNCVFMVIDPGGRGAHRVTSILNRLRLTAARSAEIVDRVDALQWQTQISDQLRHLQDAGASATERVTAIGVIVTARRAIQRSFTTGEEYQDVPATA